MNENFFLDDHLKIDTLNYFILLSEFLYYSLIKKCFQQLQNHLASKITFIEFSNLIFEPNEHSNFIILINSTQVNFFKLYR